MLFILISILIFVSRIYSKIISREFPSDLRPHWFFFQPPSSSYLLILQQVRARGRYSNSDLHKRSKYGVVSTPQIYAFSLDTPKKFKMRTREICISTLFMQGNLVYKFQDIKFMQKFRKLPKWYFDSFWGNVHVISGWCIYIRWTL